MSTYTTNKRIILSSVPFLWVHVITAGVMTELWRFDNLGEGGQLTLKQPSSESTAETVDITRGDGAVIQFPAFQMVIDGDTEENVTPAEASADATNKAELKIIVNEAPLPTSINSWTAFLQSVLDNYDSTLMVTIPMGFTKVGRVDDTEADGYCHFVCKMNEDIVQQMSSSPATLSMTFISYLTTLVTGTELEAATFTEITHKGTTGTPDTYNPEDLGAGDGTPLIAGDPFLVEKLTPYVYS